MNYANKSKLKEQNAWRKRKEKVKQKLKFPGQVVNGTLSGHPFLNHKNHASGAVVVQLPVIQKNIARLTNKSANASKVAIKAANTKGAV